MGYSERSFAAKKAAYAKKEAGEISEIPRGHVVGEEYIPDNALESSDFESPFDISSFLNDQTVWFVERGGKRLGEIDLKEVESKLKKIIKYIAKTAGKDISLEAIPITTMDRPHSFKGASPDDVDRIFYLGKTPLVGFSVVSGELSQPQIEAHAFIQYMSAGKGIKEFIEQI